MSFRGGNIPVIGRHSTIDRPESVRRVIPPATKIITINIIMVNNQFDTLKELRIIKKE